MLHLGRRLFVAAVIGAAICCSGAAADASADVGYAAQLRGGPGFSAVGGWIELRGVDDAKSLRVDIGDFYSETFADPATELSTGYITGLAGGDEVEIRQPAGAADPTQVLTLAAPTIDADAGMVFGSIPAGATGEVVTDGSCGRAREAHSGVAPGPYIFDYDDFDPGVFQTVIATDAAGNTTSLTSAAAGETPCFQVNASSSPQSFEVAVTHLTGKTLDTSRLVLLRDGQVLLDVLGDGTGVSGTPSATPRSGDELALYTPAGLLDPTYSVTLPELDAGFDTLTDLVTVNAPAASSLRAAPAGAVNFRAAGNVAAGETQFDFAAPGGGYPAFDLTGAGVAIDFANPAHTLEYVVDAQRTDVPVAPTGPVTGVSDPVPPVRSQSTGPKIRLTVATRLKLNSLIKGGLRVKLRSSAAGGARLSCSVGRTKIATGSAKARAGTITVTLKLTRSGRAALKKLVAKGRSFASRRATVTARVTDTSGASSTSARHTTIRR